MLGFGPISSLPISGLAASGPPTGTMAVTDGADTISASGTVSGGTITGTISSTDGADVMVAAGTAGPAGAAAIYEIGLGLSLMRLGGRL